MAGMPHHLITIKFRGRQARRQVAYPGISHDGNQSSSSVSMKSDCSEQVNHQEIQL